MAPDITKLIEAGEKMWDHEQLGFAAEVQSAPIAEKKVGDKVYELRVIMTVKKELTPYLGDN